MKNYKKAYTLIELAISLIILSIILGSFIGVGKTLYQKNRYEEIKANLQDIKTALISYSATHGKLPKVDSSANGEGDTNGSLGYLPYIDLHVNSKDSYGMVYQYDVLDALTLSDDQNICKVLKDVNNTTDFPQDANDSGVSQYTVAAIIVSSGEDKVLTGLNDDGSRIYEMSTNQYNDTDNNDIIIELTALELYGKLCKATSNNVDGDITIFIDDAGGSKDIPYQISSDGGTSYTLCDTAVKGSTISVTSTQQVKLWDLGAGCSGNELVRTYNQMQTIDNNGDKDDRVRAVGKQNQVLDELIDD